MDKFSWSYLNEKRRNPENNPKEYVNDLLNKYSSTENTYVTFINVIKKGVNPKSPYVTPAGVYAYNIKESKREYNFDFPFAGNAKYASIFTLSNSNKILVTDKYSEVDFKKDLEKLKRLYPKDEILIRNHSSTSLSNQRFHPYTHTRDEFNKNVNANEIDDIYSDIEYLENQDAMDDSERERIEAEIEELEDMMKKYEDEIESLDHDTPIFLNMYILCLYLSTDKKHRDRIMNVMNNEPTFATRNNIFKFNLIFQKLGYDGIDDIHGIIYPTEKVQTIIFKTSIIQNIKTLPNIRSKNDASSNAMMDSSKLLNFPLKTIKKNFNLLRMEHIVKLVRGSERYDVVEFLLNAKMKNGKLMIVSILNYNPSSFNGVKRTGLVLDAILKNETIVMREMKLYMILFEMAMESRDIEIVKLIFDRFDGFYMNGNNWIKLIRNYTNMYDDIFITKCVELIERTNPNDDVPLNFEENNETSEISKLSYDEVRDRLKSKSMKFDEIFEFIRTGHDLRAVKMLLGETYFHEYASYSIIESLMYQVRSMSIEYSSPLINFKYRANYKLLIDAILKNDSVELFRGIDHIDDIVLDIIVINDDFELAKYVLKNFSNYRDRSDHWIQQIKDGNIAPGFHRNEICKKIMNFLSEEKQK